MVVSWNSSNCPLTNRSTRLDLPTAMSPSSTSLNWQILVCGSVPLVRPPLPLELIPAGGLLPGGGGFWDVRHLHRLPEWSQDAEALLTTQIAKHPEVQGTNDSSVLSKAARRAPLINRYSLSSHVIGARLLVAGRGLAAFRRCSRSPDDKPELPLQRGVQTGDDQKLLLIGGGGGNCFSFGTHLNLQPVTLDLRAARMKQLQVFL
ncbi:tRNA wybutosine-synthesizing protein 4 [Dissostichus eleginoides]|uniref:tRNA wybutosine-synthesizing protein 4 n=1 Tax=Dissostichus eleginoides TaxID=100907 RepID=A0AAD9CHV4_DISEL|nr:tRNA wybutosine-synthesizing protein 4 [Dissostichus eleginoides]